MFNFVKAWSVEKNLRKFAFCEVFLLYGAQIHTHCGRSLSPFISSTLRSFLLCYLSLYLSLVVKSPGYLPCKFFVGCLPTNPEATSEELRQHFMQYGLLSDVYIPRPYRGFGFVTYMDGYDGQKMMAQQHTIRGSRLNITVAEPKGSHITSHKPGGGYGYAGIGSYAVDAQPVASSAGYVGYNPQYYGYGSASEYSRAQYMSPGYQSQPSVAHSSQQQPQTHQQHQYYSNGQLPPPPPPPQQY